MQASKIAEDFLRGHFVFFIVKRKVRRIKVKAGGEKKDFSMVESRRGAQEPGSDWTLREVFLARPLPHHSARSEHL